MVTFIRLLHGLTIRLAKKPATATAKALYFGRPSNNLSLGLVGLANVGKSTLFQAITHSDLGNPANYPFATIEPEKALVVVELPKLDHYQSLFGSQKQVPSNLTLYDIAGLTRNASSGQGLGNKFLADIRQVDGIMHVVRGFRSDEIIHIELTGVDPVRDIQIVNDELILKDLEYVETGIELTQKLLRKSAPLRAEAEQEVGTLEIVRDLLYEGKKITSVDTWTQKQIEVINKYNLLTAKPTIILLNVNEHDYVTQTNEFLHAVQKCVAETGLPDKIVLILAEYETQINEGHQIEGSKGSAIATVVDQMRDALHLVSFYTCGPKEAHQWTVREGSIAPEAAAVIHTDLQKTFVSAQVYKWGDLAKEKAPLNEAMLKSQGKQYKHGKKYIVEDGDVILIKAAGGKAR